MKILSLVMMLFFVMVCFSQAQEAQEEIEVVKDPKPTCEEGKFAELVLVNALNEKKEYPVFLAKPESLVVDSKGNVYVYDNGQGCIIKYTKDLVPLFAFGRLGRGPGEFGHSRIELNIREDVLYVGDRMNKRITRFDANGNLLSEHPMAILTYGYINPVMDSKGNTYLLSKTNIVDVYGRNGQVIDKLLEKKALRQSLFYAPAKGVDMYYIQAFPLGVSLAMTARDELLVFLTLNGRFFVLQDGQIKVDKMIWPKQALEYYRKEAKAIIDEKGQRHFFGPIIMDFDQPEVFYTHVTEQEGDSRTLLYEFSIKGELRRVLFLKEEKKHGFYEMKFKRHGLFYAVGVNRQDERNIAVFKEKK